MEACFESGIVGSVARAQSLLNAPVVPAECIPAIAARAGVPLFDWPPFVIGKDTGFVYFARTRGNVIKVGWSMFPSERLDALRMQALALVRFAQLRHEGRLHRLLADDLIHGEIFWGAKVDALLSSISNTSAVRFGELDCSTGAARAASKRGADPVVSPTAAKIFGMGPFQPPALSHARRNESGTVIKTWCQE